MSIEFRLIFQRIERERERRERGERSSKSSERVSWTTSIITTALDLDKILNTNIDNDDYGKEQFKANYYSVMNLYERERARERDYRVCYSFGETFLTSNEQLAYL